MKQKRRMNKDDKKEGSQKHDSLSLERKEKDRKRMREWYLKNFERISQKYKDRYNADPQAVIAKKQANYNNNVERYWEDNIKRRFGITAKKYYEMLEEQGDKCAICGRSKEENVKRKNGKSCMLSVDHDHKNEDVRGLLCFYCNYGLGSFKDNIEILNKAINYLRMYGK